MRTLLLEPVTHNKDVRVGKGEFRWFDMNVGVDAEEKQDEK